MKRAVPEGDMDSAPTTRRDMARYGEIWRDTARWMVWDGMEGMEKVWRVDLMIFVPKAICLP
jgi:hypothetical protein